VGYARDRAASIAEALAPSVQPCCSTNRAGRGKRSRPELQALIGELSVASPEFRTWWAEHDVLARSHGTKRYRHPVVGPMTVHYEASALGDEDQVLYVYSVEPGTPSADAMALLGSWAATEDRDTSGDHARQNS
jgi:hypothetical protein